MADYSLVPVDHQPEFDHSLIPVDHDPFAGDTADGMIQQAPVQPASQPQRMAPNDPQSGNYQPYTDIGGALPESYADPNRGIGAADQECSGWSGDAPPTRDQ
jgi:hypothetical protein